MANEISERQYGAQDCFRTADCSPFTGPANKAIATFALSAKLYPAIARALTLIQEHDGGPLSPLDTSFMIAARWRPYLSIIEAALAALADDRSAPEDDEAVRLTAKSGWHPRFSEFHSFCIGRWPAIAAIAARTPDLTIADNFLADFFECWRLCESEWYDYRTIAE